MRYDVFGKILPHYSDTSESKQLKLFTWLMIGAIVLMVLIALITFLLALKGEEEILVPNVLFDDRNQRSDLLTAIIKLQEKGLYASIQAKHSSQVARGLLLEQRPQGGAVVKQGRRIVLVVSEGSITDTVGNYVGKSIDEVRLSLQELFTLEKQASIKIKDPVMYEYNEAAPGTVIQQNPAGGSKIAEGSVAIIELVVSKGTKEQQVVIDDYLGLGFEAAMKRLSDASRPFTFKVRAAKAGEAEGIIVEQKPQAGEEVPEKTVVGLVMTEVKKLDKEKAFDLYSVVLTEYPVMIRIELKEKSGDDYKTLISTQSYGGTINLPYIKTKGADVVLYVNNREWKK